MGGGRLFDHDVYYDPGADPYQPWNLAPGLDPAEISDDELWDWGLVGTNPSHADTSSDPGFVVGGWSA